MSLIDFFHDQLRFAVCHCYLGMASPEADLSGAYCKSHSQLADYFRGVVSYEGYPVAWHSDPPQGLAELMHYLNVRKSHLMGCILLPVTLYFL